MRKSKRIGIPVHTRLILGVLRYYLLFFFPHDYHCFLDLLQASPPDQYIEKFDTALAQYMAALQSIVPLFIYMVSGAKYIPFFIVGAHLLNYAHWTKYIKEWMKKQEITLACSVWSNQQTSISWERVDGKDLHDFTRGMTVGPVQPASSLNTEAALTNLSTKTVSRMENRDWKELHLLTEHDKSSMQTI